MILLSDFLKKVLLDIFKYPKNSERFEKFGVSRNSFAYYIDYNNATKLGTDCNKGLKKLIFSEIKKSKSKEDELISFFKSFLTKNELDNYDNNQIINSVVDKFSQKKISTNTLNTSESKKEDSANNIKNMFESAIKYFDKDPFTALIYSEKITKKIITDIKFFEGIVSKNKNLLKILNEREIIPSDIHLYMNDINEINSIMLNSNNLNKIKLYKATKLNITNIVEWYLNDYLNIYKYRIKIDNNYNSIPNISYDIHNFLNIIKELKIDNNNSFRNDIELSKIEKKIILKKREIKKLYIDEPKNILIFNYSNELISSFKKDLNDLHSKELMDFEIHYCYMLINTGVLDNILIARKSLNNIIKKLIEYIDVDFRIAKIYENAEWLYSITYCIENNISKAFKICEKAIYNLEKCKSDQLILTRELFVLSKDKSYTKKIIKSNNYVEYDIIGLTAR
jgi:hypothetical protein